MKKNLLNLREGGQGGGGGGFLRAVFSLAGYPFENVATTVEPTDEGRREGRKGRRRRVHESWRRLFLPSLSRARDYSDVMLMRMATKEISRRRGGGERRGWGRERERKMEGRKGVRGPSERWVGGRTHPPFSLPSRLSMRGCNKENAAIKNYLLTWPPRTSSHQHSHDEATIGSNTRRN